MNVLMPQLGETVTEGTISKWYKAVGDTVAAGDLLFDIETDKTSMEVPAVVAGTLREIRAQTGQTVAVGSVVAIVGEQGEVSTAAAAVPAPVPAPAVPAPAANAGATPQAARPLTAAPVVAPIAAAKSAIDPYHGLRTPEKNFGKATLASGAKVTPLARRLAVEAGLNLAQLQGSGPRGRIVATDIRNAIARRGEHPVLAAGPGSDAVMALYAGTAFREVPLDGMRKTIARRLSESKQQVPHFYVSADLDVEALLALRKQINASAAARVSVNDLLVKAYALALKKVSAANVVWAGDRLLQFDQVDIGVAVAVPGGLVTPILRAADTKGLLTLAGELAGLIARGRERKLQPAEYTGGSASVSNLGMYGVRNFQAIVNPPQSTILAVGAAERRPIEAADGTLRATTLLSVSLSVDHRAVDGATAGELLAALREIVENPVRILL